MTDPSTPLPADGRTLLRGPTTMAGHVVARIAALAAERVEGVHVVAGRPARPDAPDEVPAGFDARVPGVRADVGPTEAVIDVRLVADHGVRLPGLSEAVCHEVVEAVRTMTGLTVTAVHVEVVDLHLLPGAPLADPPPSDPAALPG